MPNYVVIEDGALMFHQDRQRAYEVTCDGCGRDYGTRWPHGIRLAVITDRSGSEQASTHIDPECIARAAKDVLADLYGPPAHTHDQKITEHP